MNNQPPTLEEIVANLIPALGPIIAQAVEKAVVREIRHQHRVSADPEGWMTQAAAADYLKISPKTLCQWRSEGRIKAHLVGKRWRYSKEALDAVAVSPWLTR